MNATIIILALTMAAQTPAGTRSWTERGPDGGAVPVLVFAPTNPAIVYAGTSGNGVFCSTDSGLSWRPANWCLPSGAILSLAVHPHDAQVLFAGMQGGMVFRSEDGGQSWRRPAAGFDIGLPNALPKNTDVNVLTVDPFSVCTVFAGTTTGIFRSRDCGVLWTAWGDGALEVVLSMVADPRKPGVFWAGAASGLFHSIDNGESWQPSPLNQKQFSSVSSIAVDPSDSFTVFIVSACTGCGLTGAPNDIVFRSIDGGETWKMITGLDSSMSRIALAIDPHSSTHIIAANDHVLIESHDRGDNWTFFNQPWRPSLSALVFDPGARGRLLAGSFRQDGIMVSSDDGHTWTPTNRGLRNSDIRAIVLAGETPHDVFATIEGQGIAALEVKEGRWRNASDGLLSGWGNFQVGAYPYSFYCIAVDPQSPSTLYAGGGYVGVFKSVDAGRHWVPAREGLEHPGMDPRNYPTPWTLSVDPRDSQLLFAGTDEGLFVSSDGAGFWRRVNASLPWSWVESVVFDPALPSFVYCSHGNGIYRSTDRGNNWQLILATPKSVRTLIADPARDGRIYASVWNSVVYRSDNHGSTWSQLSLPATLVCDPATDPASCPTIRAMAIDPSMPGSLYLGTPRGVWQSNDDGETWSEVGNSPIGAEVTSLAIDGTTGTVYAGTTGKGLISFEQARVRRHPQRNKPPFPVDVKIFF